MRPSWRERMLQGHPRGDGAVEFRVILPVDGSRRRSIVAKFSMASSCRKLLSFTMQWQRWLIGKWSWKRPLRFLALLYGCLLITAVFFAEKLFFFPPPPGYEDSPQILKLTTSDGNSIAAIERPSKPGFPTLLYTHGNAEDLGDVSGLADAWENEGFGVLPMIFPATDSPPGHLSSIPAKPRSMPHGRI